MNAPLRKLSADSIAVLKGFQHTSTQVRYLDSLGYTRGEIKRLLLKHCGKDKRYQHIRNILVTEVKNPTETWS
jgi:hypothetical protein